MGTTSTRSARKPTNKYIGSPNSSSLKEVKCSLGTTIASSLVTQLIPIHEQSDWESWEGGGGVRAVGLFYKTRNEVIY